MIKDQALESDGHLVSAFTMKLKHSIRQVALLLYVDFNISELRLISTIWVY